MKRLSGACVLLGLVSVASSQGQVWVVDDDGGPGVDFTSLGVAATAAGDGDVLLVRSGDYADGLNAVGKSLTVQAEQGATPILHDGIGISLVGPDQTVVLRGLTLLLPMPVFSHGIRGRISEGTIWIEDCTIVMGDGSEERHAAEFRDCGRVVILRSAFEGGHSDSSGEDSFPGAGLFALRSNIHAFDSTFRGGAGGCATDPEDPFGFTCLPNQGGAGASLSTSATLFASGCAFVGGRSGGFLLRDSGCLSPRGGPGLRVLHAEARTLDSIALGGPGWTCGGIFCACGPSGPDGVPVSRVGTTTYEVIPGEAMAFFADSAVREGASVTLTAQGPAYSAVWLGTSMRATGFFFPPANGSVVLRLPIEVEFMGVTDADGLLSRRMVLDPFTIGTESEITFRQVYYAELHRSGVGATSNPARAQTRLILGSGSMTVGLDSSF